jgi:hypothetical protein
VRRAGGYTPKVNAKFGPLVAHLTDEFGNPLAGWTVLFQSVNIGRPGATFDKSDTIGAKFAVATDPKGDAKSSTLTANGMAGTYKISATVLNGNRQPVKFKGKEVSAEFPIENK